MLAWPGLCGLLAVGSLATWVAGGGAALRSFPILAGSSASNLPAIVYTDRYGNALTGMRAGCIPRSARIDVSGWSLSQAETYATAPPGAPFWYENANGLVEIAVDRGSAAALLDLRPGTALVVDRGGDRADR